MGERTVKFCDGCMEEEQAMRRFSFTTDSGSWKEYDLCFSCMAKLLELNLYALSTPEEIEAFMNRVVGKERINHE